MNAVENNIFSLGKLDDLATDIELLMGYEGCIPESEIFTALSKGLDAFPHLRGRIDGTLFIDLAQHTVYWEYQVNTDLRSIEDWQRMSLGAQSAAYLPQHLAGRVFAVRVTYAVEVNLTILGLRVSHAVVDGTGLALFLIHSTASLHGITPPAVVHERAVLSSLVGAVGHEFPDGYEAETLCDLSDPWATIPAVYFAVRVEKVAELFAASSSRDAKMCFAAWLCHLLANHFVEVAVWCDVRGLCGVPATYTGNIGCYIHEKLHGSDQVDLKNRLSALTRRSGIQRITRTFAQFISLEKSGIAVAWQGLRDGVLQLNLVPHMVAGTDFGYGVPAHALLLSRNSSGIRLSLTPDARHFLVEACFPDQMGDVLFSACAEIGLSPMKWCCEAL